MIHSSAIIDKEVVMGTGVGVGAYARVEKGVVLGNDVRIAPYVHIKGDTHIGDGTFIASGAVIGEVPQILQLKSESGRVRIGARNVIREYVTIHRSSSAETSTVIGDDNFLMALAHVAHDCQIGNHVVVCNGALIAGHVEIGDRAFVSGNVVIHQFVRIGRLAMIAGLARVNQDVPPFMMVVGDSRVLGINAVGLQRAGIGKEVIHEVRRANQVLFRSKTSLKNALAQLNFSSVPPEVGEIVRFIESSSRGICGPRKNTFWERLFLDYPYYWRIQMENDRWLKRQETRFVSSS